MPQNEKYENLPVQFDLEEMEQLKDDLAGTCQAIMDSQAEFNDVVKGYQDEINGLVARRDRITGLINRGYDVRAIKCYEDVDLARGKVYLIRKDTNEKVNERDLTDSEKTGALLGGDDE